MAPHARAKIVRRDATKARQAPGVVAVLLAEDVPGENNSGPVRHDEPLFATDEILFHGQIVALVVGESVKACRAAAALVEVEYEALPALVGIPAAVAAGSFHTEPHTLTRGDCAATLAMAPERVDGEFTFGGQEHFYLETHAAWAEAGEDGAVTVNVVDAASLGNSGRSWRRCSMCRATKSSCRRRAWAAVLAARKRRATRGRLTSRSRR
jgi:xanthine dehydrogenase large subunit